MGRTSKVDLSDCNSIIDGLKKVYKAKIRPLEETYKFHEFVSPPLSDSDFDAKPMVLLLGQYSVGKTSFIEYLLERKFPGSNIGPEPTTDRFCAVMYGPEDRITPGNALAVAADKPFRGLSIFGTGFLSKFQSCECVAPILENVTFMDTPGVLSGEKQRLGRTYDFVKVAEWFAERSDMILLLFDAHKLDISDEFKRVIEGLKGHDDKVRVVLNKADGISPQQLIRVYGALMWSLGKVFRTPEVVRVYVGSFWDQPYENKENAKLFEAEQMDLIHDLRSLPANSTIRKVNELVKRARNAKVHAYIIAHLRKEMPSMFGKEDKQNKLINGLADEFAIIQREISLPPGDFPDVGRYKELLSRYSFSNFPKFDKKLMDGMEQALSVDLPSLLKRLPWKTEKEQQLVDENMWKVSPEQRAIYVEEFEKQNPVDGKLSGAQAKDYLTKSKLGNDQLKQIWNLADMNKDGFLDLDEFIIAVHVIHYAKKGVSIPSTVPATLNPNLQPSESSNPF